MIIQATSHGTAAKEEPFAFTYSGDFTDNRVDGVGTVRLNTSGTLTVTGKAVTVSVTIVGAGGGAAYFSPAEWAAGGGSGGIQTKTITLKPGVYDIVIGTGGAGIQIDFGSAVTVGGTGGNTTAFDETCTGGKGGDISGAEPIGGTGGVPNGTSGKGVKSTTSASGGSPNGGAVVKEVPQNGGDGYVEITFS